MKNLFIVMLLVASSASFAIGKPVVIGKPVKIEMVVKTETLPQYTCRVGDVLIDTINCECTDACKLAHLRYCYLHHIAPCLF